MKFVSAILFSVLLLVTQTFSAARAGESASATPCAGHCACCSAHCKGACCCANSPVKIPAPATSVRVFSQLDLQVVTTFQLLPDRLSAPANDRFDSALADASANSVPLYQRTCALLI